jgi:arginine decarboxylase
MKIYVTHGTGTGPTPLAAFDAAALTAAGINHNMIYLSSFIPKGGVVERTRYVVPPEAWGQRVYVVMAREDAHEPRQEAWAGLGWVQDESGRGMFVEHHGRSRDAVHEAIHATLDFMIARRNMAFGPIHYELAGIECEERPVCALVMAVYEVENWAGS